MKQASGIIWAFTCRDLLLIFVCDFSLVAVAVWNDDDFAAVCIGGLLMKQHVSCGEEPTWTWQQIES